MFYIYLFIYINTYIFRFIYKILKNLYFFYIYINMAKKKKVGTKMNGNLTDIVTILLLLLVGYLFILMFSIEEEIMG